MAFDNDLINRLSTSFRIIEPQLDEVVTVFYRQLFEAAPQIRSMFPDDLGRQKKHMVNALLLVAKNVPDIENLIEPLREMGARHISYGTREEHFPIVRDTMVYALGQVAGYTWTPQLNDDWTHALDVISGYMIEGMRQAHAQAA